MIAVLIDPDKYHDGRLSSLLKLINENRVDMVFVGGSLLVRDHLENTLKTIKNGTGVPVVLFPGSLLQISANADALLLLSLISGRNADLLIGKHVIAAPYLKASGLEILPTGYMLIESGHLTTAHYISNTLPIPRDKDEIAVCTAMAGEMLGLKLIYMDAGSGAASPVTPSMIGSVRKSIGIPLIVGGGIRSPKQAVEACRAGADVIVVGNAIENDESLLKAIATATHSL